MEKIIFFLISIIIFAIFIGIIKIPRVLRPSTINHIRLDLHVILFHPFEYLQNMVCIGSHSEDNKVYEIFCSICDWGSSHIHTKNSTKYTESNEKNSPNEPFKEIHEYKCPICGEQIGKEYIQYVLIHAKHIKYPTSKFLGMKKNEN